MNGTARARLRGDGQGNPDRGRRLTAALTLAALLAGCAGTPASYREAEGEPLNPAQRTRLPVHTVAVAAARFDPTPDLQPLVAATAGRQAAVGAGAGALQGAGAWAQMSPGSCSGELCGAFLVAYLASLPVFMAVGAIIGAAQEASQAETSQSLAKAEQDMQAGLAQLRLQETVQQAVVRQLAAAGFENVRRLPADAGPLNPVDVPPYMLPAAHAVLEPMVVSIGVDSIATGGKRLYSLVLRSRGRLVRPDDGKVLDEMLHTWKSPPAPAKEWVADNGQLFVAALNRAVNEIAENLVYELLLLYYPPPRALQGAGGDRSLVPAAMLLPRQPALERRVDLRAAFVDRHRQTLGGLVYTYAEGSQPLLEWEAFPRAHDLAGLDHEAARISEVVYDLRLYRSRKFGDGSYVTGALQYERSGLKEPRHRVEEPLDTCARYTWTVRARFRLDDQPRATEWGSAIGAWAPAAMEPWEFRRSGEGGTLLHQRMDPSLFYFPFRVPSAGGGECR